MDFSDENMTSNNVQDKRKSGTGKSTSDSNKISPLGISRYGRTRKPKISQDFCSIDDVIDNNEDDIYNNESDDFAVKESKLPIKTFSKLKLANANGTHSPIKDTLVKPKYRTIQNNNSEIVHITGDSDVNYTYACKGENLQKSRKFFKSSVEDSNVPVVKHIYVTKEKIPEIKDKKLSEELKPILSEEIFQSPSIDISEVFKIISNKSHDLELETNTKQNNKGIVKTYSNKRKSFKKPSTLIESFGLPDEPIVPINNENVAQPLRISEIDVEVVKPESVNLINRELVDSLWKISSPENNYMCHGDNDILATPIFDVRGRFTPTENNIDENVLVNKTVSSNKHTKAFENKGETIISIEKMPYANSTNRRSPKDSKILKTCTEENIIPDSLEESKNLKKQSKQDIKKKNFNLNANFSKSENDNGILSSSNKSSNMEISNKTSIVKIENSFTFDVELQSTCKPKKRVYTSVYETNTRNLITKEEKNTFDVNSKTGNVERKTVEKCDMEDQKKASNLNRKYVTDVDENEIIHSSNNIDINKLKNQINSRIELIKSEEQLIEQGSKYINTTLDVKSEDTVDEKEDIDLIPIPLDTKTDKIQYELGDLMWAKIGRYPYWPCLITEDPVSKEYKKDRYRYVTHYHVRFFADNGRRSWISDKNLLSYDTNLEKLQKESKHEVIMPQPKSKSYKYWMMGIKEANSVREKLQEEKLEFFNKMLLLKKRKLLREAAKKRKLHQFTMKRNARNKIAQKRLKAASSSKLKQEILENLKDMVAVDSFKRVTRSTLHKRRAGKSRSSAYRKETRQSFNALVNKDDSNNEEVLNYDSKKHDLSNSSDDEVSSKSSISLTLESQTALYKRNNLFKGVSKERVCQICEKPHGVIKCKGRCNGYYHVSCASRKIKTDDDNFVSDMSVNMQEFQLSTISETNLDKKPEKFENNITLFDNGIGVEDKDVKDLEDVECVKINEELISHKKPCDNTEFTKRTRQNTELQKDEIKNHEKDSRQNVESRKKTRRSESAKIETIKHERNDNNFLIQHRRITRSCGHEVDTLKKELKNGGGHSPMKIPRTTRSFSHGPEIIKRETEEHTLSIPNRRITRSCSQGPEMANIEIKNAKLSNSSRKNRTVKPLSEKDVKKPDANSLRQSVNHKRISKDEDKKECIDSLEDNVKKGRRTRRSLNQIFEVNEAKNIQEYRNPICLIENIESIENQIVPENKIKEENDQIISSEVCKTFQTFDDFDTKIINTRSSSVKIVNIKKRKKSDNSPTLTLNNDPEFKKLPLLDQIDHKMKEVMQKIDRNPLYADSTTDYTSSEESALDLLSPRDKRIKDHLETDFKKELEPQDNGYDKIISAGDFKEIKSKNGFQNETDFKCLECSEDIDHACFVCHKEIARSGSNIRQKCSLFTCGKFYHPECLKIWPQTQWSVISTTKHRQSNTNLDTFVCPVHVCHTCVSDDPRVAIPRCTSDKVVKCLRCPATYHNSAYCIPAGTEILSSTQIICPRHLMPQRIIKQALPIINTTWCFICSKGGDLICCEMCPTSVHAECLEINLTEDDTFICEDCETGRFPLYDEIVWVKLGSYRWWPAVILFPNEVPDNIRHIKHNSGEFVVRFFGTNNHHWAGRGRVFLFQEGDSGDAPSGRKLHKVDTMFKKSIQEATEAHIVKKEFKQAIIEEASVKMKYKPPPYIKIKVNRPVGNVRQFDGNISNTTPCECDPKKKNPCSADSDCLNRLLLTECNPEVCPAGEKCQNQNFEKRNYPPLVPYRTETRGWGLKSLEPIKKGQFVIEYVGEMIAEQEYQRRIKKMHAQKEENYYFLTIDKDRMLDAGPKGNVARFMNHSCQPNCETQKWTVNGDTRVGLFSVVDIPANMELTFNYNLECVGKEKKICKCGASNCSGYIGVKAKQEESHKKLKSKIKHKKKRPSPAPVPEPTNKEPCFICGQPGDVGPCNNKICTKYYHLKCVNLNTWPDNKWACPWHNCNICTKRTIRCCVKCINSYCPVHSEGNVRYDKLLGFICSLHDPNKADSQEMKVDNTKKKETFTIKLTEENDVTSTTCDELDHNTSEKSNEFESPEDREQPKEIQHPKKQELTPKKLSDHAEVVTSTPIKFPSDNTINDTVSQHFEVLQSDVNEQSKRKRGRPKKSLIDSMEVNTKRIKLDDKTSDAEIERQLKQSTELTPENVLYSTGQSRKLRTSKVVNYGGLSEKLNMAQKRLENNLPIRKRSSVRCETVL